MLAMLKKFFHYIKCNTIKIFIRYKLSKPEILVIKNKLRKLLCETLDHEVHLFFPAKDYFVFIMWLSINEGFPIESISDLELILNHLNVWKYSKYSEIKTQFEELDKIDKSIAHALKNNMIHIKV